MATMAQLRYSPLACYHRHFTATANFTPKFAYNIFQNSLSLLSLQSSGFKQLNPNEPPKYYIPFATGGSSDMGIGRGNGGNDGSSGGWGGGGDSDESRSSRDEFGPIGAFLNGWRSRVAADPQFPFKVLMEEIVGVSANVLGDMASRPNFGLNELDFVFSTLVVGVIVNFVVMYLLAPTMASSTQCLPSIFAKSPVSYMFEPGVYSLMNRVGTFVYKGTLFAVVGFAAGLVGTGISNGLIKIRKNMDPKFETPNKAPPMVLNAVTWAIHMGFSSNFRYQTLNGIEYLLDKAFPPVLFKTSVVVLRCLNNVIGGMSFVVLARLTGSQSVDRGKAIVIEDGSASEKVVSEDDEIQTVEPASK